MLFTACLCSVNLIARAACIIVVEMSRMTVPAVGTGPGKMLAPLPAPCRAITFKRGVAGRTIQDSITYSLSILMNH